jgi:predicted DNA-binding protein with PD1-like motif
MAARKLVTIRTKGGITMIRAEHEQELVVRLKDGEGLISSLVGLGIDSGILLNGVGMLRGLELGYWNGSSYEIARIDEPVELLSLQGNFARKGEECIVHCHATVAKHGGTALGGHVIKATVHNTAEIFIYKLVAITLERKMEETGLAGLYPR